MQWRKRRCEWWWGLRSRSEAATCMLESQAWDNQFKEWKINRAVIATAHIAFNSSTAQEKDGKQMDLQRTMCRGARDGKSDQDNYENTKSGWENRQMHLSIEQHRWSEMTCWPSYWCHQQRSVKGVHWRLIQINMPSSKERALSKNLMFNDKLACSKEHPAMKIHRKGERWVWRRKLNSGRKAEPGGSISGSKGNKRWQLTQVFHSLVQDAIRILQKKHQTGKSKS